jgi:membrane protein DedA with SNARE-associated domain
MGGTIVAAVEGLVTTPWVYVALLAFAALDGVLPLVPAETLVITLGVWAATTGTPHWALIVGLAALGAFIGDHISFAIGRRAGPRIVRRLCSSDRNRRRYDWIAGQLERRGGLVLVVARFLPGGRTIASLTTGATGFPRRRFSTFDAIGCTTWAGYGVGLGYLGGTAFRDNLLAGAALGLALGVAITAVHEALHIIRNRRAGGA